ncbi:ABC drug exporter AtrF [Protomyces lactucae-debilis]|uniref:ABC drug exporter AtrF n=1 Tax=Protomyces lactucae-debilis TaxID=2754530 RepID=A0A1Y2FSK4_PROLT|nr:ABC drug exporter AtrF [Protomyces lactucae-debilis]ORY86958.1 ABC drug exporter AtrF [Protomyces lactucae-debilis]
MSRPDTSVETTNSGRTSSSDLTANDRSDNAAGRWGEHTSAVNTAEADQAFHDLRQTVTKHSMASNGKDEEQGFNLERFLRDGQLKEEEIGRPPKRLGVVFRHLTVHGVDPGNSSVKTFPKAVWRTVSGQELLAFANFISGGKILKAPTRPILRDFDGFVKNGEMLLVLGRPGAGCSTMLRAVANQRGGFAQVDGDVHYGSISAEEMAAQYRGEVNYLEADDVHEPALTVEQTLRFALENKTQQRFKDEVDVYLTAFLRMFGIEHTRHTQVGGPYHRGVSGGERKRVSIAEVLATKSSVVCWDNSTRGLDASTALDYGKSLRILTDVSQKTTITTLYQAGQSLYDLFDKVCVVHQSRMIYFGPIGEAEAYFEGLGFAKAPRQTTPDFLTAITDPIERSFQPGKEASTPKSSEDLERAFRNSSNYARLLQELDQYQLDMKQNEHIEAQQFREANKLAKSKYARNKSQYTVSFPRQVINCSRRNMMLIMGDKTALGSKFFSSWANALIIGSLFYGLDNDSNGAFSRGGLLFISILFNGWLALAELGPAVGGRAIIARHKEFGFYRPSAVSLARVVSDLPLLLIQIIPFTLIMYFLGSLQRTASQYFIFLLFVYTSTLNLLALYRLFAALSPTFDNAIRYAGLILNAMAIYAGYVINKTQMLTSASKGGVPWFGWLYYASPVSYAFEAVMVNEFSNMNIACSSGSIVPEGPSYTNVAYQTCTLVGSVPGSLTVRGADYLQQSFAYTRSNLWRDFGILLLFTVAYIILGAIFSELFLFASTGASLLQFKNAKQAKRAEQINRAIEEEKEEATDLVKSKSVFTFRDLCYSVDAEGSRKQLLDNVQGWVEPGTCVALVGSSGAGKTTLLNTLAQRNNSIGYISGEMLVDGHALGPGFARGTGFVEQQDLHDETATIREAFEFSALLRQSASTPKSEKLDYVNKVLALLELEHLQDVVIMSLDVEAKKRLTIGVELCARPNLLLFLDEPTSGLDSQSAFNIVRFLRRLAAAGQAIICTIHQPSSELLLQFDRILALNPGGKTFYFGDVGKNGSGITEYFGKRGAICPPDANPAEFLLEVGTGRGLGQVDGHNVDWAGVWSDSEERKAATQEIRRLEAERSQHADEPSEAATEFAASTWEQTKLLTKRTWLNYWRDASYGYSKAYAFLLNGLLNGFTFWMVGNRYSILAMQERMFSVFLLILMPATLINAVIPKFFSARVLFEARESPSRIYSWFAFATAQMLCEIPWAIGVTILYWVVWYWPAGLPVDASISGYIFLMALLFNLYSASWGQWIASLSDSYTVIANIIPLFLVVVQLFTGIIRPYASMPVFWKYFIYYVSPVQWLTNGMLATILHNVPVSCSQTELAFFSPPPGQTCSEYASEYLTTAIGYLDNPDATSQCGYCQFSSGDDYLRSLNISYDFRWQSFGIFLAFVLTNYLLIYGLVFLRFKGYRLTFGVGHLMRLFRR